MRPKIFISPFSYICCVQSQGSDCYLPNSLINELSETPKTIALPLTCAGRFIHILTLRNNGPNRSNRSASYKKEKKLIIIFSLLSIRN